MAKNQTLKTASVLAFERKLDCSDGKFFVGAWGARDVSDWPALVLREKAVRGTISNRLKTTITNDPAKLDAEIQKPNLQTVDVATLPEDADTLRVRFTLKVLSGVGKPSACNSFDYQDKLMGIVSLYAGDHGYAELALRYATNLANGRFLWRNRIGAEEIEVLVRQVENGAIKQAWTFQALDLDLRKFDPNDQIRSLGGQIQRGLLGQEFVLLEVVAHARMGKGQEVFPSQELVTEKGKGTKSKFLYSVGDAAAIHSQKIGNAIRTIDDWYVVGDDEVAIGPISVEPYGSVTSLGKAFRPPKEKHDFYTLLDRWVLKDEAPSLNDQHYVMANFIRGGVFGEKAE